MYKVEICFDMNKLDDDNAANICRQMDLIFENEDLCCTDCGNGKRIYQDKGRKQDYGRFWAAIFALKDAPALVAHLKECFWYNGSNKENLMTEFLFD